MKPKTLSQNLARLAKTNTQIDAMARQIATTSGLEDVARLAKRILALAEVELNYGKPAAPAKVETPKLWTCTIVNEPGETVTVHLSEAGAYAEAFSYVKDQWKSEYPDETMPKDQHTAIEAYFSGQAVEGRETCDIKPATLRA